MSAHDHHRHTVNWDGIGAGVSMACALHCAALPLVFGLLPGVQMALQSWDERWSGLARWLLWTHDAERLVVSSVIVFAAIVLLRGFRHHRDRKPLIVAGVAAVAMATGAFGQWHSDDLLHVLLQVGGGLGIATAHILNLRRLHRSVELPSEIAAQSYVSASAS